jgi:multisubunit Na+/H+ antiporter MnhG subunit
MKKFSQFFYNKIDNKVFIISVVVLVLFISIANPLVSKYMDKVTQGAPSPDTSLGYSASDIFEMAGVYGEQGRRAYIIMRITFDLVFPAVYLFFLVSAITRLSCKLPENSKLRMLNLIPFLAVLFDLIENTMTATVMGVYPKEAVFAASVAPYASVIKWAFVGTSFVLVAILAIYRLTAYISNKNTAQK